MVGYYGATLCDSPYDPVFLLQTIVTNRARKCKGFESKKGKAFLLHLQLEFHHAYDKLLFHDTCIGGM
jgi:hypothetical protein